MRALERYTGVLYDALDAESLGDSEWAVAADAVAVQSALFGLVGADDPSRRTGCRSTRGCRRSAERPRSRSAGPPQAPPLWRSATISCSTCGRRATRPSHRCRTATDAHYVRVLARDDGGHVRALNHFNKQAKGLLDPRADRGGSVVRARRTSCSRGPRDEGYELRPRRATDPATLELVVPEVPGRAGARSWRRFGSDVISTLRLTANSQWCVLQK